MTASLRIERIVPAAPDRIWLARTTEAGLAAWWWKHLPGTTFTADARLAGRYRIDSPAAGIGVRGEFLEVDAPRRLVATWIWLDDGVDGVLELIEVTRTRRARG